MKTFEARAMGDVMHFLAPDLEDAKQQLDAMCGPLPDGLVNWREVKALPDGDEYAADMR
jgi:hypothetical protein